MDQWTAWRNFTFGIPREPHDFITEAINKGHPRDIVARVPQPVKDLLTDLACGSLDKRFAKRASFMKRWLKRSLELKEEERKLHENLPGHLQGILKGNVCYFSRDPE